MINRFCIFGIMNDVSVNEFLRERGKYVIGIRFIVCSLPI